MHAAIVKTEVVVERQGENWRGEMLLLRGSSYKYVDKRRKQRNNNHAPKRSPTPRPAIRSAVAGSAQENDMISLQISTPRDWSAITAPRRALTFNV